MIDLCDVSNHALIFFLSLLHNQQSRHFDAKYQAYYWHNSDTGQSVWDEHSRSVDSLQNDLDQMQRQPNIISSYNRGTSRVSTESILRQSVHSSKSQNTKSRRPVNGTRGVELTALSRAAIEEDGDDSEFSDKISLLHRHGDEDSAEESSVFPSQESIVRATTSRDIWMFTIYIYINAFLIEGPLAACEGVCRSILFLVSGAFILLTAVASREKYFLILSGKLFREASLCAAATLTLLVPGAGIFVYRRYHQDGEWDLSTVPTILGHVDSRRFISFSYGNGSFASNVRYDTHHTNKSTYEAKIEGNQELMSGVRVQPVRQLQRQCLDTWSGEILLEPRKIQFIIVQIVRGEDPLGILHS